MYILLQNNVSEDAEVRSNPAKLLKLIQITQAVLKVLKYKYLLITIYAWEGCKNLLTLQLDIASDALHILYAELLIMTNCYVLR